MYVWRAIFEVLLQLVAGLSPRTPGLISRLILMAFMFERLSLRPVSVPSPLLRFPPVSVVPPLLHTLEEMHPTLTDTT